MQLLAVGAGDINTGGTDTRESANGLQSCQTVDDGLAASFLDSLGLSHLTARLRLAQLCPNCHQVMPLTGICGNCG